MSRQKRKVDPVLPDNWEAELLWTELNRIPEPLPAATAACPNETQLAAYFTGKLSASERPTIAHHVRTCGHCRGLLDFLTTTAVRTPAILPAAPMSALPQELHRPRLVEQLWQKLKDFVSVAVFAEPGPLLAYADTGSEIEQIRELSSRQVLLQTNLLQLVLFSRGQWLILSVFTDRPQAVRSFGITDIETGMPLQPEKSREAEGEVSYTIGTLTAFWGKTLAVRFRLGKQQYEEKVQIRRVTTNQNVPTLGLHEVQYQIDFLGNYLKGLERAAELMQHAPSDRHLQTRLKTYLVQKLTHAGAWLPDLSSFPLPLDLRSALRSLPAHELETKTAIGEVLCLLVDRNGNGFVRLFRCRREQVNRPSGFSPNITAAMKEAVLSACREVDRYLETHHHVPSLTGPETGYFYEIVGGPVPPEAESLDGRSVEAAAALAYLSVRTQVPLPATIAVTGRLEGLSLGTVGGVAEKIKAAVRERPYLTRIFIPSDNALPSTRPPQVEPVPDLPTIVDRVFRGHFAERISREELDISGTLNTAVKEYYEGNWQSAFNKLNRLLKQLPISRGHRYSRFVCWWRIGSIATHWGDVAQADTAFAHALDIATDLWKEGRLSNEEYLNLYVSYAVHLTDLYRYKEAEDALGKNPVRQGQHRYQTIVEVRRLGSLGQLYRYTGRLQEAEQAFQAALGLIDPETERHELPREHTYLGTLYTDMGHFDQAEVHFRTAEEVNKSLATPSTLNEIFTSVYASRLWYLRGRHHQSQRAAERAIELSSGFERIFPGCLARRYQGLSLLAMGQKDEGRQILREEMAPPVGAVDWPSPNIRVIRDVSIIELALDLLQTGDGTTDEVRSLVRHVLSGLKNFSAAFPHFKAEIARLQRHLGTKALRTRTLTAHLTILRDKIHT
jgi:tetratricopeptide (TPR) repeat protein